jgi:drug/metabolite transporter (DMT)-like permease
LFAFTAYFLASKRFRERVGAWEYVVGMTTVAGIVVVLTTVATGQAHGSPTLWEWVLLAGIAVFPGTLGHLLANWAHAHVSAFVASMMLLAVPVIATAGAFLVLGEDVRPLQVAGAVVVLGAIAIIVRSARRAAADALVESVAGGEAP